MTQFYKYKKTMHLPFSQGLQNDDRRMEDETCFDGKLVAITVKMDGENTSMYRDGIHARSLYAMSHPSQHYIKGLWGTIAHEIPEGWRICGENMYARHSIEYNDLESFFYVFSVWNEKNECLPIVEAGLFCHRLGLTHVELASGLFEVLDHKRSMEYIESVYHETVANGHEGIVVRNADSFHYNDFSNNLAKAVRKNHVQTDVHWTKTWVPNKLKEPS